MESSSIAQERCNFRTEVQGHLPAIAVDGAKNANGDQGNKGHGLRHVDGNACAKAVVSNAVERARCEQHDRGLGHPGRGDVLQHAQQFLRVVFDGADANFLEHLREGAFHRAPVFQHVTHAGGTAPVIFEHEVIAFVIANEVGAADVNVNILGHIEVHELAAKMFSRENVVRRDDAILEDLLLVIKIVQEKIQCRDALRQAAFQHLPLFVWDDARQQIERENLLRARRVAIDIERHALPHEREVHRLALEMEFLGGDGLEQLAELGIVGSNLAAGRNHFIEKSCRVVTVEKIAVGFGFERAGHLVTTVGWLVGWRPAPQANGLAEKIIR